MTSLRLQAMQRIFGAIVALCSLVSLPPLLIALALDETSKVAFIDSFLLTSLAGLFLWWPVRHVQYELRLRDGFLITSTIWVLASFVSAIPFTLADPYLSYTDAVFEAVSGGAAASWQMLNRWATMSKDEFDFGFAVDWMRKDLGLALDEARTNGATLPVASLVDQFYADVQKAGNGRRDTSSLVTRLPK